MAEQYYHEIQELLRSRADLYARLKLMPYDGTPEIKDRGAEKQDVKDQIRKIAEQDEDAIDIAIKLCLYCMKTQIFLDGNKRAAVIFANHYLISHGGGFLVIPEKEVPEFKHLLVKYYEGEDSKVIASFMKQRCWKTIKDI